MAKRLWEKDLPIDERIHLFTVGDDPEEDLNILPYDCDGTAAHVRGLGWIKAMDLSDVTAVVEALATLKEEAQESKLAIPHELEDGHTLIESLLTERIGEAGRKIHLGRSRNDQVATAMRLWLRAQVRQTLSQVIQLTETFVALSKAGAGIPMPGYTHRRRAMPSSIGQWAASFAEALLEEAQALIPLDDRFDRCPLGSGAGFGVPLDLDREYTATLLGFTRVQISTLDVQNSRGRYEAAFVHSLASVGLVLERAIIDLLLFSTEEFGFVRLPDALTTGSSIMPQKRNPDVFELARGRIRELRGLAGTVDHLSGSVGSSYHRDFQLLKAPTFRAARISNDLLEIINYALPRIEWDPEKLEGAISMDLFATQVAYEKAANGQPFRDAYAEVANQVSEGRLELPTSVAPSHQGSPGDLRLWMFTEELKFVQEALRRKSLRAKKQLERLYNVSTIETKP